MNGNLKPFARAEAVQTPLAEFIDTAGKYGCPPHDALRNYEKMQTLLIWLNDEYQVAVDQNPPHGLAGMGIWHLSIKRLDRAPLHDWRDLQRIKEMICGEEFEALELYPARDRVVDTSNQYHLFVFMHDGENRAPRIPLGWTSGMTLEPDHADGRFNDSKARQRPSAANKGGR